MLAWALGRPAVAAFLDLESRHRAAIEREIAAVCRATTVKIAEGHDIREVATPEHIEQVLDRFLEEGAGRGIVEVADMLGDEGFIATRDADRILEPAADCERNKTQCI